MTQARSHAGAPRAIRVGKRLAAAPRRVFDAWLDPALARQWLFATASTPLVTADVEAREGGAFRFVYARERLRLEYTGRYVEIAFPRRLSFALALPEYDGAATRVTVDIGARNRGSALTLLHDRVPAAAAAQMKARWTGMLHGLALLLAGALARRNYFFDDPCRFHGSPFDYPIGPPRFTHP